ncbi:MAG: hypothetical protein KGR26_04260 [Cyanobacteria bacterium REEB65]|nr:hypothetical protein [Cyanobacteria bacterium REEB65]
MNLFSKFGETITVKRTPAGLQLALSGPFVAGNLVALDVNGAPIAPVAFTIDDPTTLAALADAIAAMPGVESATVQGGVIVVQNPRSVALTNVAITGGAAQPTATVTGGFISGAWVPAQPIAFSILAVAQPMSLIRLMEAQLLLPEGIRTKALVKFLTAVPLLTAGEGQARIADIITWRDVDYQVQQTSVWDQGPLKHYEALASKIEQES